MSYLMSEQPSELERLQLQSLVWEPAGRRLMAEISSLLGDPASASSRPGKPGQSGEPNRPARSAVDVGCGALGWLRLLDEWAGSAGRVVGTDVDPAMLGLAQRFVESERLGTVTVVRDDLFASRLPAGSFDVVHARFQIVPLGRAQEQLAAYLRLARPGGVVAVEDPDSASWHCTPDAPCTQRLIELIREAFREGGGDFDAGRHTAALMRAAGLDPHVRAEVVALSAGHPYLRLPIQFSASLRHHLQLLLEPAELDDLIAASAAELEDANRSGLSFTLMQTWALVP